MAFVLNSNIKIGEYSFQGVNECTIKKSVKNIVDTATIKMPGRCQIRSRAVIGPGPKVGSIDNIFETATLFKEGDPVSIELGYNGDLRNEFKGFVRRVNIAVPVSIDLEGYAWQLRNQNIIQSWGKTTIREVLERIIQGTDIVLNPDIPVIPLNSFSIPNRNGLDTLDWIKQHMLLTVYFDDNVLYVGPEELRTTATDTNSGSNLAEVKYSLGKNIVSNQPELKQRLGKDNLVRVRLKTKGKDGKTTLYEVGDTGGQVFEKTIPFSTDKDYLKTTAEARLKKLKYDGFEGKITGFLQPFCKPGWKATLTDKRYNGVRSGTYFIPSVEVTFGAKGARRHVEISYRLDIDTLTNIASISQE